MNFFFESYGKQHAKYFHIVKKSRTFVVLISVDEIGRAKWKQKKNIELFLCLNIINITIDKKIFTMYM